MNVANLVEIINAAISSNNSGCEWYVQGEKLKGRAAFRAAASILHPIYGMLMDPACDREHALVCARKAGRDASQEMNSLMENENSALSAKPSAVTAPAIIVSQVACGNTPSQFDDGTHSCSSFLAHDVIILEFITNTDVLGSKINTIAAAIILNLALTYMDGNEYDIIHALSSFESAYSLVTRVPVSCYISEHVALVALNNATHILRELGDFDFTKEYADTMMRLIRGLPMSASGARREFRSRFMLNAMIMRNTTVARAA